MFRIIYEELVRLLSMVKSNDLPMTNALIGLTGLQGLNLLTIVGIVSNESGRLLSKDDNTFLGIFLFLALTIFNYITQYLPLKKQTEARAIAESKRNAWVFWLYFATTLVSSFYFATYYYDVNVNK
ncbi:MAG: hypothetical protein Q8J69_11990 [Sphingobacteriaceae bacterium]|nr:hypothetical protein [Sphingobacteriaceae bacterium]